MFTLSQKVFAVRNYYKGGESVQRVLECLTMQYGVKANPENLQTISRIIRTFENTGSVLNRFYYNNGSGAAQSTSQAPQRFQRSVPVVLPKRLPAPDPVKHEEITTTEIEEDDLIVEVLSDMEEGEDDGHLATSLHYETDSMTEDSVIVTSEGGIVVKKQMDHDDDEDTIEEETADEEVVFTDEVEVSAESIPVQKSPTTTKAPPPPAATSSGAAKPQKTSLCPQCGETVNVRLFHLHMKAHLQGPQEPKIFKCEECDKVFKSRSNLHNHKSKHDPSAHFVCEICAKVSTNKSIHKNHMLVSEKNKSSVSFDFK